MKILLATAILAHVAFLMATGTQGKEADASVWQQLQQFQATGAQLQSEFNSAKSANDVEQARQVKQKIDQLKAEFDAYGAAHSEAEELTFYFNLQRGISQLQANAADFVQSQ